MKLVAAPLGCGRLLLCSLKYSNDIVVSDQNYFINPLSSLDYMRSLTKHIVLRDFEIRYIKNKGSCLSFSVLNSAIERVFSFARYCF